jgi:hypothetical protein
LPDTGPGAVVMLTQVAGAAFCNGPCDGPATFVNDFPGYDDPQHPIDLTINFSQRNHGQARSDLNHAQVYKLAEDGTSSVVPDCGTASHHGKGSGTASGVADPAPCVARTFTSGSQVGFEILYLSGDPGFSRR